MTEEQANRDKRLRSSISHLDTTRSYAEVFTDFIDMILYIFCLNPTEEQHENMKRIRKSFDKGVAMKATLDLLAASVNYHDALGETFMQDISHGSNDQFFTPQHMAELMARVTMTEDAPVCKVMDSCCGSGRLLLAAAKTAKERGKEFFAVASDVDMLCVKQTMLNIILNNGTGVFACKSAVDETSPRHYFSVIRKGNVSRWLNVDNI